MPEWVWNLIISAGTLALFGSGIKLALGQRKIRDEASSVLERAQAGLVRALQERHDHAVALKYDDVMAIEPEPEGNIKAWTPLEREAFGVNETIALIDRIERELDPPPVDSERLYARGGYVPL